MKKNIYKTILIIVTLVCIIYGTMNHVGGVGRNRTVRYDIGETSAKGGGAADDAVGGRTQKSAGSAENSEGSLLAKDRTDSTVTELHAAIEYGSLFVQTGTEFSAEFSGDSAMKPEVSLKNGILTITQKQQRFQFFNGLLHPKAELTVTVPEGTVLDEAKIDLDLGDLSVSGISVISGTAVNNLGQINLASCRLGAVTLEADLGDVTVRDSLFESLYIEEDLGNVTVASAQNLSGADLDLETDLGKVLVNGEDQGTAFRESGTEKIRLTVRNDLGDVKLEY